LLDVNARFLKIISRLNRFFSSCERRNVLDKVEKVSFNSNEIRQELLIPERAKFGLTVLQLTAIRFAKGGLEQALDLVLKLGQGWLRTALVPAFSQQKKSLQIADQGLLRQSFLKDLFC